MPFKHVSKSQRDKAKARDQMLSRVTDPTRRAAILKGFGAIKIYR